MGNLQWLASAGTFSDTAATHGSMAQSTLGTASAFACTPRGPVPTPGSCWSRILCVIALLKSRPAWSSACFVEDGATTWFARWQTRTQRLTCTVCAFWPPCARCSIGSVAGGEVCVCSASATRAWYRRIHCPRRPRPSRTCMLFCDFNMCSCDTPATRLPALAWLMLLAAVCRPGGGRGAGAPCMNAVLVARAAVDAVLPVGWTGVGRPPRVPVRVSGAWAAVGGGGRL